MAIQIDPKLPIYNKLIELIPRIGTAKFMKALVPIVKNKQSELPKKQIPKATLNRIALRIHRE